MDEGGHEFWLLKPNTYMNESGRSVAAVMRFYKIEPAQMLVVHDELDLPPGTVKLKKGGGAGGHNGLTDIIEALDTQGLLAAARRHRASGAQGPRRPTTCSTRAAAKSRSSIDPRVQAQPRAAAEDRDADAWPMR